MATLLHDEIGASIERTLFQVARRNEIRVAWVRVVALAFTTALNAVAHLHPPVGNDERGRLR